MTAVFSISMVILLNLTLSKELNSLYEDNAIMSNNKLKKIIFTLQDKIIEIYVDVKNLNLAPIFPTSTCAPCEPIKYCECGDAWCTIDRIVGTNINKCNKNSSGILHLLHDASSYGLGEIKQIGKYVKNGLLTTGKLIKKGFFKFVNIVKKVTPRLPNFILKPITAVTNAVSRVGKHVTNAISNVGSHVTNAISNVGSHVTNVISNVGSHVTNAISSIGHFIGL
jgi:hypothetical protein